MKTIVFILMVCGTSGSGLIVCSEVHKFNTLLACEKAAEIKNKLEADNAGHWYSNNNAYVCDGETK